MWMRDSTASLFKLLEENQGNYSSARADSSQTQWLYDFQEDKGGGTFKLCLTESCSLGEGGMAWPLFC